MNKNLRKKVQHMCLKALLMYPTSMRDAIERRALGNRDYDYKPTHRTHPTPRSLSRVSSFLPGLRFVFKKARHVWDVINLPTAKPSQRTRSPLYPPCRVLYRFARDRRRFQESDTFTDPSLYTIPSSHHPTLIRACCTALPKSCDSLSRKRLAFATSPALLRAYPHAHPPTQLP